LSKPDLRQAGPAEWVASPRKPHEFPKFLQRLSCRHDDTLIIEEEEIMNTLTDKGRHLLAAATLALAGIACPAAAQTITEFPLSKISGSPVEVAIGPGGDDVWFTESNWYTGKSPIGRISTNGAITEFPIPTHDTRSAEPGGIAAGPDGNLWFTAADFGLGTVSLIGRITPEGALTEFPLNPLSAPCHITPGPDGNLWFTECNINGSAIGRITTAGVITEFPLPTRGLGYYPTAITSGPDGNLWFTEPYVNRIGRITTKGVITEFQIPTVPSDAAGITAGPDGNLWFTESAGNRIGRITTGGLITEFSIPTAGSDPRGITAGPDGNLWFAEYAGNRIGRITTAGLITELAIPTTRGGPFGITAGPDGKIWFTEVSGNQIGRISLPFSGVVDLSVGPDEETRVLRFDGGSGQTALDGVDDAGSVVRGATYGPYPGWTARAVATGADGLTRVLWTSEDGSASLWLEGSHGNQGSFQFGPMSGWSAVDVAAGIAGTTHLLWTREDASVALWTLDGAGQVRTKATYGPYPGWTASAISDGADGLTRLLWKKLDGTAGLSIISAATIIATDRYDPADRGTAIDIGVGGDNKTRILWRHPDGRVAIGIVAGTGEVQYGPVYPSPGGLTARHVAAGPDGSARVLFTDGLGGAILWVLSPAGVLQGSFDLPGPTPSGGNIAGAWNGVWNHSTNPSCDASATDPGIPARAIFEQDGSIVRGTLTTAFVPCGWGVVTFRGTLQGYTLAGTFRDEDGFELPAHGFLSNSSLEITIDNGGDYIIGWLHVHR
jgi:streptogramin lyase